jgi:hypothetical protein
MWRTLPALLLLLILLTGCARTYVITMSSGARITTHGKPKLRGSTYFFEDAKGQPGQVSAGVCGRLRPLRWAEGRRLAVRQVTRPARNFSAYFPSRSARGSRRHPP